MGRETSLTNMPFLAAKAPPRVRLAVFVAVGLAISYIIVMNSAGFILRGAAAPAAVALGVSDAQADADFTQALYVSAIADPKRKDRDRLKGVERRAIRILERDVLVPEAWRLIGMAREALGHGGPAVTRLYEASDRISRRDVPTQLLLFESYAKSRRFPQAFRALDLGLRQSDRSRGAFLPILAAGIADPQARPMLRDALSSGVSWRDDFYLQLAKSTPEESALSAFFASLPRRATLGSEGTIRLLAANLVQKGDYGAARAALTQIGDRAQPVTNAGFETANVDPPLDWELQSTSDYDAAQGSYGGQIEGKGALYLRASTGVSAQVARQILFLRPAAYQISALAGPGEDAPLGQVDLLVACAVQNGATGRFLGKLTFSRLDRRKRESASFEVPADGCRGQWLTVSLQGDVSRQTGAWLDSIHLERAGNGTPVG